MTPDVFAPLARILLRYLAGVMIARGFHIDPTDPDFASVLSWILAIVFGAISEGWWYFARKKGWPC